MDKEKITEDVLDGILSLVEHDRMPTWLELDRFIRSLGYCKIKNDNQINGGKEDDLSHRG